MIDRVSSYHIYDEAVLEVNVSLSKINVGFSFRREYDGHEKQNFWEFESCYLFYETEKETVVKNSMEIIETKCKVPRLYQMVRDYVETNL